MKTQLPPLTFADASLLFAIGSIILLIISELSLPYYGQANLTIDKGRLRKAAFASSALFLASAVITIVSV
jgi:hypothetical protein